MPGILALSFAGPVAVIGDIHGRADLLDRLLAQLGDVPVLVAGDVCDRGPDSRGVIDRLIARGARGVLGNHDEWLRAWALREGFDDFALHPMMGGRATLDSYGVTGRTAREIEAQAFCVPSAHAEWLRGLADAVDLQVAGARYWVTHAGFSPRTAAEVPPAQRIAHLAEANPRSLRWPKTAPQDVPDTGRTVIMGHVPLNAPLDLGHVIAIDTGAGVFPTGAALTAVVLPERRFVTVRDG